MQRNDVASTFPRRFLTFCVYCVCSNRIHGLLGKFTILNRNIYIPVEGEILNEISIFLIYKILFSHVLLSGMSSGDVTSVQI